MSKDVQEILRAVLKEVSPLAVYTEEANLRVDLNLDSLDVINFLFEVETRTKVKISEVDIDNHQLLLLGNLRRYIEGKIAHGDIE